jgi:serine/threonine protein phosphatase PrpC
LAVAREAYKIGFPGTGHVGSCCLAAVIHGNKVYSANAGDCKGVIANLKDNVTLRKINHKQNASSKKE